MRLMKNHSKEKNRKAYLIHDALIYFFENLSKEKYENWRLMRDVSKNIDHAKTPGFPYVLHIEPTNICNLSCAFCPSSVSHNELNRERRHLKYSEFQSVIDDMERWLLFAILWDWGEPFTNPELPEMIRYVSSKNIQSITSTNGHFLHKDSYCSEILKSGLTTLIVAVESIDPEKYAVYRKGGDIDKVIDGLRKVVALKKALKSKTHLNLRMVLLKSNEHQVKFMKNFAKSIGFDSFTVKTANPWHSHTFQNEFSVMPDNPNLRRFMYKNKEKIRKYSRPVCPGPWTRAHVNVNGEVISCGRDYEGILRFGNIFEKPLSQIWNSAEAQAMRKKQIDKSSALKLCQQCNINFFPSKGGEWPSLKYFYPNRGQRIWQLKHSVSLSLKKLIPDKLWVHGAPEKILLKLISR